MGRRRNYCRYYQKILSKLLSSVSAAGPDCLMKIATKKLGLPLDVVDTLRYNVTRDISSVRQYLVGVINDRLSLCGDHAYRLHHLNNTIMHQTGTLLRPDDITSVGAMFALGPGANPDAFLKEVMTRAIKETAYKSTERVTLSMSSLNKWIRELAGAIAGLLVKTSDRPLSIDAKNSLEEYVHAIITSPGSDGTKLPLGADATIDRIDAMASLLDDKTRHNLKVAIRAGGGDISLKRINDVLTEILQKSLQKDWFSNLSTGREMEDEFDFKKRRLIRMLEGLTHYAHERHWQVEDLVRALEARTFYTKIIPIVMEFRKSLYRQTYEGCMPYHRKIADKGTEKQFKSFAEVWHQYSDEKCSHIERDIQTVDSILQILINDLEELVTRDPTFQSALSQVRNMNPVAIELQELVRKSLHAVKSD